MEFCPEIAVLQSAFQLVSKMAGEGLSDLPKEKCQELVKIISCPVEEICSGLACDLDMVERTLWQEKLHTLHLYALVKKKYKPKQISGKEGRVPMYTEMDMMSELLPIFSSSFYFELMKTCGWTDLFLQSLQCLDYRTASILFEDLLLHCQCDPVTFSDEKVITIVTEKLLSRCMCVPSNPSEMCVKLLYPLNQSVKYVQTVYPENSDSTLNQSVKLGKTNGTDFEKTVDNNSNDSNIGVSFFDAFVDKNPQILDTVISSYESTLENLENSPADDKKEQIKNILKIISQLGIWSYLLKLDLRIDSWDKWFINNVVVEECGSLETNEDNLDLVFSLNFTMLQCLSSCFPIERLNLCLKKSLGMWLEDIESRENSEKKEVYNITERVHIVKGLSVNLAVLIRMIKGLHNVETTGTLVEKSLDSGKPTNVMDANSVDSGTSYSWETESEDLDIHAAICQKSSDSRNSVAIDEKSGDMESIKIDEEMNREDDGLVLGVNWTEDVSLEALLRRVDLKLPQYQVCVDRLLEEQNRKFWRIDRLYEMFTRNTGMLSRVDRVLQLIDILDTCKGNNSEHSTEQLLLLVFTAFSELSFPDQDTVVMETYINDRSMVTSYLKDGLESRVTNVFNKITADLSNQVLSEISLLSLGDPGLVLRTAVNLCVRNEQQARNCAMIAQHLAKTCQCRHPHYHSDISLVAMAIQDFLPTHFLSDREQSFFCLFVSELMKTTGKKQPVLSPVEFLHTFVLSNLSENKMWSPHAGNVSRHFAASLLLRALEAGCNESYDWSEYEFEPMALVLLLAKIKQECVELWESKDKNDGKQAGRGNGSVTMETSSSKLILKEKVEQCLDRLCQMVSDGYISVQQNDVRWLVETSSELHWTVKLALCPFLSACNLHEYSNQWMLTLDSLLEDLSSNLVIIMQFVAINRLLVPRILDNITKDTQIESSEIIMCLIQMLPQCLAEEFHSVVMFLEQLLASGSAQVALTYRLRSTFNLPLLDFTDIRPVLYTSQLLGDTIIALATTLTSVGERRSMLPHILQCYINMMKDYCDQDIDGTDLQMFFMAELFHHVCEVALNLSAEFLDSVLVCLLHIIGKFKDISMQISKGQNNKDVSMAICKGHVKVKVSTAVLKLMKNIENGMIAAVQELPENCEEKHMMLKKLIDYN